MQLDTLVSVLDSLPTWHHNGPVAHPVILGEWHRDPVRGEDLHDSKRRSHGTMKQIQLIYPFCRVNLDDNGTRQTARTACFEVFLITLTALSIQREICCYGYRYNTSFQVIFYQQPTGG